MNLYDFGICDTVTSVWTCRSINIHICFTFLHKLSKTKTWKKPFRQMKQFKWWLNSLLYLCEKPGVILVSSVQTFLTSTDRPLSPIKTNIPIPNHKVRKKHWSQRKVKASVSLWVRTRWKIMRRCQICLYSFLGGSQMQEVDNGFVYQHYPSFPLSFSPLLLPSAHHRRHLSGGDILLFRAQCTCHSKHPSLTLHTEVSRKTQITVLMRWGEKAK